MSDEKFTELKSLGGGTTTLIKSLLEKFNLNTPRLASDTRLAVSNGDKQKVDYCVHTMKGSALSLGITGMSELLVKLNTQTKNGDLTGIEAELDKLDAMLIELIAYSKTI